MKGLLKKWVLTGKQFEDFRQKNSKIPLLPWRTKQKNHKTPGAKTEHESCSQGGINWSEIEKAFRMKLFELCKTRTKKSSPDLFNFNVISAGHGVTNDDDRATTCRRNFKAPWLQTERTKKWGAFWKNELQRGTVWNFKTKKPKNPLLPWRTKQKNNKTPEAKPEHEPMQAGGKKLKRKWNNHSE